MDFKKLLKSLGFSEQYPSKKSKVFSGFGLGVIASVLLLTVIFLNYPLKVSLLYPVFQGFNGIRSKSPLAVSWRFPLSPTSSNSSNVTYSNGVVGEPSSELSKNSSLVDSSGGTLVTEKSQSGGLSNSKNNSSFVAPSDGELVSDTPQSGNFSTSEKNSSSVVAGNFSTSEKNSSSVVAGGVDLLSEKTHGGNASEILPSDGKLVSETPQSGNFSTNEKNSSSVDAGGGNLVSEKTHGGNASDTQTNSTLPSEAPKVSEKPQQGNLSKEVSNTKNSSKEISSKPIEVKSVENNRTGTFIGYSPGFADNTTNKSNAVNVSESVKSNGTPESVLGETHELKPSNTSNVLNSDGSGLSNDFVKCDFFDGRWVRDEGKPYYPAGSCPYIDRDFDCHINGRPDSDFVKWRWQPNHCNIPSLNATDFLERLRGKRLVFVGDSLNRNMWESLVCILRHSVANKKKVYEISGKKEFKKKGFYAFHYEDFNCSIDFVSSPFLVRETPIKSKNGLTETLRLDLMDRTAPMYHDADVIVFNTGHWWTHEKTSKGENYYQEGNHVYPRLKVMEAYTKALKTWGRWIDKNVNVHKSQVFFRGYSVTHFKGGQWNSGGQCHKETEPIYNETHLAKYPSKMRALENVLQQIKTPVTYLNISRLTDYRKDAHPSIYRKQYNTAAELHAAEASQDCSHWCLPGVPDTWNELLYASLLKVGRGSWGN